ncbi:MULTISPECIES: alpha/beta fold hydrolase [Idiomarina]|uniref:alpha/beta fold hydrolase n=1 Tax=Idiomarina TaxID=135575 RepID=UPI00129C20FF|nr:MULTISPECIES: alpha/beta fold hydrolase [Idiomarina]MRJ42326.1 alpha/beta fold hydrolase [Idiomarina sp. FeN1]NCU57451.1 alpha/beta fold hydrolase [Idiomarina sp. FenA--70]NCU60637.1 alpha/beta fold hydrolase [Idiomarina sp. FenBw--71]UUN14808.1 alpha/beta fold hydrolase [Idiomarina loihiensis]
MTTTAIAPSTQLRYQQARHHAEPVSFDLPWGTMRGLQWGPTDGYPLLALHGWLDNCHSFLPLAEEFLQSDLAGDYRLIALDWAGHGHSDHRPAGNYYPFIDYVYDIWSLCQQQQWPQVAIVAHSMGAYAANMLAGIAPELVSELLAIEAFGLIATAADKTTAELRQGFRSRWQQQQKQPPRYPNLDLAISARAQAGDFSRELAALLVERGIEQFGPEHYQFRADGQLRVSSAVRLTAAQIGDVLAHIECPFTVLLGSHGHQRLKTALQDWREQVPHLRVHEVEGGHHVHMERPDAIIGYLSQIIRHHNG